MSNARPHARRAAVWRYHLDYAEPWCAEHTDVAYYHPGRDLASRIDNDDPKRVCEWFPTHAEALAYAIRAVGLAPKDGEDQ